MKKPSANTGVKNSQIIIIIIIRRNKTVNVDYAVTEAKRSIT